LLGSLQGVKHVIEERRARTAAAAPGDGGAAAPAAVGKGYDAALDEEAVGKAGM
jgi:hypothetical protein